MIGSCGFEEGVIIRVGGVRLLASLLRKLPLLPYFLSQKWFELSLVSV